MTLPRRSPRIPRRSPRLVAKARQEAMAAAAANIPTKAVRRKKRKAATSVSTRTKKTKRDGPKQKAPKEIKKAAPKKAPNTAPPKKKRKADKPKETTPKKIKMAGLKKAPETTTAPLGVIDVGSGLSGKIHVLDSEPCDVMLALVDPSKNMDKFFILQLIDGDDGYVMYTRWGRTGTAGQAQQEEFGEDQTKAEAAFGKKFRQKTGLDWESRDQPLVGGKYRFIRQDFNAKAHGYGEAKWQYWVDDGVDGKTTGWYDYTRDGSVRVERLFAEHARNPDLSRRIVSSGFFSYDVDLTRMLQTNTTHGTARRIRRCQEDSEDDTE